MRIFKHPLFWVLCVIAGMFTIAGAIKEPSQRHKAQYAGEPREHDEKAAQPNCASPTSVQDRLAVLRKQITEVEDAVTEFKAKNDIVGAAGKTIVDQQIVELRTQLTKARSQLSDASPSEKQILETNIQNLEAELKTAVSKLRASNKALINLRMLESGVQTLRAFYDGLMRRAAEYNCAL